MQASLPAGNIDLEFLSLVEGISPPQTVNELRSRSSTTGSVQIADLVEDELQQLEALQRRNQELQNQQNRLLAAQIPPNVEVSMEDLFGGGFGKASILDPPVSTSVSVVKADPPGPVVRSQSEPKQAVPVTISRPFSPDPEGPGNGGVRTNPNSSFLGKSAPAAQAQYSLPYPIPAWHPVPTAPKQTPQPAPQTQTPQTPVPQPQAQHQPQPQLPAVPAAIATQLTHPRTSSGTQTLSPSPLALKLSPPPPTQDLIVDLDMSQGNVLLAIEQSQALAAARSHPKFRDLTADQANYFLSGKPVGELILRPSSREGCLAISFTTCSGPAQVNRKHRAPRLSVRKSLTHLQGLLTPVQSGWELKDTPPTVRPTLDEIFDIVISRVQLQSEAATIPDLSGQSPPAPSPPSPELVKGDRVVFDKEDMPDCGTIEGSPFSFSSTLCLPAPPNSALLFPSVFFHQAKCLPQTSPRNSDPHSVTSHIASSLPSFLPLQVLSSGQCSIRKTRPPTFCWSGLTSPPATKLLTLSLCFSTKWTRQNQKSFGPRYPTSSLSFPSVSRALYLPY